MSDDKKKHRFEGLIENIQDKDGSWRSEVHPHRCERVKQVETALNNGERLHHPDCAQAAKCGPAMVNSDAYRSGWEGIFGKKPVVGQA